MSAAIGCGSSSRDFFEGAGARSGGGGTLPGNAGTAGSSAGKGGYSGNGDGGATPAARGGGAGADDDGGAAGAAGDAAAGAPVHPHGGAPHGGHGGAPQGGHGNAGIAGEVGDGGTNAGDAGAGGRTSGEAGAGGHTSGAGGHAATSGAAGDGGTPAGGRDGSGGVSAEGGAPNVAGAAGESGGVGGEEDGGESGRSGSCDRAERCDGADNDCDGRSDDGGVCPESCRGFELEGRAYMFCTAARGHFASARICDDAAMDLVRIDSARENAGVLAAVQRLSGDAPPGSVHIGATDFGWGNEGNFRWPNGAVFWIGVGNGAPVNGAYANWDRDEPNNYDANEDCAEMLVAALAEKAGLWNDVRCTSALSFVCEE